MERGFAGLIKAITTAIVLSLAVAGCGNSSNSPAAICTGQVLATTAITTDTTLNGCYLVNTDLDVSGGATLTIDPGSTLLFASNVRMIIRSDGALVATGTVFNPVLLTGQSTIRGFWKGLTIAGSANPANLIDYVIIEYGATTNEGAALSVLNFGLGQVSHLTVQNTTLKKATGPGIYIDDKVTLMFTNNTVTDNALAARVHINRVGVLDNSSTFNGNLVDEVEFDTKTASIVDTAQTFDDLGVPYSVLANVTLLVPVIINPGAQFIHAAGIGWDVDATATLTADGNIPRPINFRGRDRVAGYWSGIRIFSSSLANRFDHVTLTDAGGTLTSLMGGTANGAITLTSTAGRSDLTLTNSDITNSANCAVWMDPITGMTETGNVFEGVSVPTPNLGEVCLFN